MICKTKYINDGGVLKNLNGVMDWNVYLFYIIRGVKITSIFHGLLVLSCLLF